MRVRSRCNARLSLTILGTSRFCQFSLVLVSCQLRNGGNVYLVTPGAHPRGESARTARFLSFHWHVSETSNILSFHWLFHTRFFLFIGAQMKSSDFIGYTPWVFYKKNVVKREARVFLTAVIYTRRVFVTSKMGSADWAFSRAVVASLQDWFALLVHCCWFGGFVVCCTVCCLLCYLCCACIMCILCFILNCARLCYVVVAFVVLSVLCCDAWILCAYSVILFCCVCCGCWFVCAAYSIVRML